MKPPISFITAVLIVVTLTHCLALDYIDCYKERKPNRYFAASPGNYDPVSLTPQACVDACTNSKYEYAGMTWGKVCFCADVLPPPSEISTSCTVPCTGGGGNCGSQNDISVYKTTQGFVGLELSANAVSVAINTVVTFDVSLLLGPSPANYEFDYGDGAGFTDPNATPIYTKQFGLPGEYNVMVLATHPGSGESEEAAIAIHVQQPVAGVSITCPAALATFEEINCHCIVIAGSDLEVSVSFEDEAAEVFPIADPGRYATGFSIPENGPVEAGESTAGFYVMPASEFKEGATLVAWEFSAEVIGDVHLAILTPDCLGPNVYCFESNTCEVACLAPMQHQCTGTDFFCPSREQCSSSLLTPCPVVANRYANPPAVPYKVKSKETINVGSIGYNFVLTASSINVSPGDILAYYQENLQGKLHVKTTSVVEEGDFEYTSITAHTDLSVDAPVTSPNARKTTRTLLRAITAIPSTVLLTHEFLVSGDYNIAVTVANKFIAGSLSVNANVTIQEGINATVLIAPTYFATNEELILEVGPHTGDEVSYNWTLGDGTPLVTTIVPQYSHMYNAVGQMNVYVVAYNQLSNKADQKIIDIQDKIVNLRVTTVVATVGLSTTVTVLMDAGTAVTCALLDYGDLSTEVNFLASPSTVFPHTYMDEGSKTVSVSCSNGVSNESAEVQQVILYPITGLTVVTQNAEKNVNFNLQWTITQGSSPTVTVLFDTVDITLSSSCSYDIPTKTGTCPNVPGMPVGNYVVQITASNAVSNQMVNVNIDVQVAISGATLGVNLNIVNTDDPIEFSVDMTEGSAVTITWNYNDGSPLDTFQAPAQQDWSGTPEMRSHAFAIAGVFNVVVIVSNGVNVITLTSSDIKVYPRLEDIEVLTNSPVTFSPPGYAEIYFNETTGVPSNVVAFSIDYGDSVIKNHTLDATTKYLHAYMQANTYTLDLTITNEIKAYHVPVTIKVIEPIVDMKLEVFPQHASKNQTVAFKLSMYRGGLDIMLGWNFGDGTPLTQVNRIGISPDGIDEVTHIYEDLGWYQVEVSATNDVGQTMIRYDIACQDPVEPDVTTFSTTWPKPYPVGIITLNMAYSGSPLPTNATITWFFGDGNKDGPKAFVTSDSVTHTFLSGGDYMATLIIENLASRQEYSIPAGVYEDIIGLTVETMYRPNIPLNGQFYPGKGVDQNEFASNWPIIFKMSKTFGTVVKYLFSANRTDPQGNGEIHLSNFTTNPFSYELPAGTYDIIIEGWNPLFLKKTSTTVISISFVENLTISDGGVVTGAGEMKDFNITFGIVGSNTCLMVDFGDNLQLKMFGVEETCALYERFDQAVYFSDINEVTNPMALSNEYTKPKRTTITVTAFNVYSTETKSLSFPISILPCKAPILDIIDKTPYFFSPVKHKRGTLLRNIGTTSINCNVTIKNDKRWTILKVDPLTGNKIVDVDISQVSSEKASELALDPNFLDYGLYKFIFTVTLDTSKFSDGSVFTTDVHTYMEIVKSDLVGVLYPGGPSGITVGSNEDLTLSPELYSFDPDQPMDSQTFDSFDWFCRSKMDPAYDTTPTRAWSWPGTAPLTPAEIATGSYNQGGCFYQDKGRINYNTGSITFNTESMKADETYEFLVILQKDTRITEAYLDVKVVQGTPPRVSIECFTPGLCHQMPEYQLINPTASLHLSGVCEGANCDPNTMVYSWKMYRQTYPWKWREIEDLDLHVEGINSQEIVIKPSLFETYGEDSRFQVQFDATPASGPGASSNLTIAPNRAPVDGGCIVSPTNGRLYDTEFKVKCENWTDSQPLFGRITYQFFTRFQDESMIRNLGITYDSYEITLDVPEGPAWDNYNMDIYVWVSDDLDAVFEMFLKRIQMEPVSPAVLEEKVTEILTSDFDYLEGVISRGDLDESSKVFVPLASALNTASKASCGIAGDGAISVGFGPEFADGVGSCTPVVNATAEDVVKYEEDRSDRAEVRTDMVVAVAGMTVATLQSAQVAATVISTIVHSPEEVSREAQVALVNKVGEMAQTIKILSATSSPEQLRATITQMIDSIGQLQVALGYHAEHPLNSDVAKAGETALYDVDLDATQDKILALDPEMAFQDLSQMENKDLQETAARDSFIKLDEDIATLITVLEKTLIPGETPINIVTPVLSITVAKNQADLLSNKVYEVGFGSVGVPDWCSTVDVNQICDKTEITTLKIMEQPSLIHATSEGNVSQYSSSITVSYLDKEGNVMKIANTREFFQIVIPRSPNLPIEEPTPVHPVIPAREWEHLHYHAFSRNDTDNSVHIRILPDNPDVQLLAFVRFGAFPNITLKKWDFMQLIPSNMALKGTVGDRANPDPYTFFISDADMTADMVGKAYIGLRELSPDEFDLYSDVNKPPPPKPYTGRFENTNYTIKVYCSACYYYKEEMDSWLSDGCQVGPLTSEYETECLCNHLTTFASGWLVAPNAIDWDFVFSNLDFYKNPTLYVTEIVILVVYILSMIWARRQDKKDIAKLGLTPLKDNDRNDKYYYEVVVITGMRKDAGTTSKVYFILSGENDETDVRNLSDDKRKILQRSGTDSFLMSTSRPLGALNYARIWHDNSGKGKFASWFLKYFLVRDLQTNEKFYFICDRWLAVEEDDGQVDRIIPVAGKEQMVAFSYLFSQTTRKNLSDGHLWFSVVARPPQSRFTRCQRVSCCLCLLFTSMLTSAMWYNTAGPTSGQNSFGIGPFTLSPEQIFIGFAANLIVFPTNLLLVTLFRKARLRKKRLSRLYSAFKSKETGATSVTDVRADVGSSWHLSGSKSVLLEESKLRSATSMSRPDTSMSMFRSTTAMGMSKKKKGCELPWWFMIVSWILLWGMVLTSAAFVTFYGISFADESCKQWITSMLISFFASVFITQPVKVFLTAIFFSLIIKNPGGDDDEGQEDELHMELGKDEEYIHNPNDYGDGAYGAARPRKIAYKPPDASELQRAKNLRLKEIKMWEVIREIVIYAFFLWILMVISYRNRSPDAYQFKNSLERVFIHTNSSGHSFRQVNNTNEFWNWAQKGLPRGLRADKYYNNGQPFHLRGFIADKVSRIMGYATMRQLRITRRTCMLHNQIVKLLKECNDVYSISEEETSTFGVGWTTTGAVNSTRLEYRYSDSEALDGYPFWGILAMYGGGGYVHELRGSADTIVKNMEMLQKENWIDKYTRAVFVEFTVFNPQANLFGICTLLAEFHPTGGVSTIYRFEPAMLLPYQTGVVIFQIACEVIYVLFMVYFLVNVIRNIVKQRKKFFKEFWNIVEVSILLISIAGIVIYFYKFFVATKHTDTFKNSHGNDYVKFQYAAYLSELFSYMVGWVVFLGTLKFLRLLRFNKRMSLLASTLKRGAPSLLQFGIIFAIVFMAFIQLFYLVFAHTIYNFARFVSAMESGVLMMMGKFDIHAMTMVEPVLTPLFFFFFVITVTFVLVNMFMSILNESFSVVRADLAKQNNDHEIVNFMVSRFKLWTGFGSVNKDHKTDILNNQKNVNGPNSNVYGQIDNFPDRIDRLLSSITTVYGDKDNIDFLLDPKSDSSKLAMKNLLKSNAEGRGKAPFNGIPQRNQAYMGDDDDDDGLPKISTN